MIRFKGGLKWAEMVKLRPKKYRKRHVAADLNDPAGRRRANRELVWGDHGFLRARFRNLHQISDEMWRGNQPGPKDVERYAAELGIKTIINLRGESTKGYYLLEKEACERHGVVLIDYQMFSRDTPTKEKIFGARDLFDEIAYPAFMHCKSGADRAGIMSFLYMMLRAKVPLEEAAEQISFKYLHVKQGKTGVLDAFVDAYRVFNATTPKPFLDWVAEDYDRLAVKQAFIDSGAGKLRLDQILRRE